MALAEGLEVVELTLGAVRYRITAGQQHGRWIAAAVRLDNGDHIGPEISGASEQQALDMARGWLEWQHDHALALDALQQAERAYHRIVAGNAFASNEEAGTDEPQRDALDAVDAARRALDAVRGRRPL